MRTGEPISFLQHGRGVAIAVALLWGGSAFAQTPSAGFTASATIVTGCELNNVLQAPGVTNIGAFGQLSFGTHSSLTTGDRTAAYVAQANLTFRCSAGVTLSMTLGTGGNFAVSRGMKAGAAPTVVRYRLYSDPGLSQELISQTVPVAFTSGSPISLPIYGKATLSGTAPPGAYVDTITVTLVW